MPFVCRVCNVEIERIVKCPFHENRCQWHRAWNSVKRPSLCLSHSLQAQIHYIYDYAHIDLAWWVRPFFDGAQNITCFAAFFHVLDAIVIPKPKMLYGVLCGESIYRAQLESAVQTLCWLINCSDVETFQFLTTRLIPIFRRATYGQTKLLLQTLRSVIRSPSSSWDSVIQFWLKMCEGVAVQHVVSGIGRIKWSNDTNLRSVSCYNTQNPFHRKQLLLTHLTEHRDQMEVCQKLAERCLHTRCKGQISCIVKHLNDEALLNSTFLTQISLYLWYGTSQEDHDFWLTAWQHLDCCTLFWCAKLASCADRLDKIQMKDIIGEVLSCTSKERGYMFQRYQKRKLEQSCMTLSRVPKIASRSEC